MGLAIGSRPSIGVFLLPVAYLLARGRGPRAAGLASIAAVSVAALCLAPVLANYDLEQLAPTRAPWLLMPGSIVSMAGPRSFGRPGFAALLIAVACAAFVTFRGARRVESDAARALERALLLGLILDFALFVWMPYEEAYLLPSIAMGSMLVATRLPALGAWALAGALALSSFVDLRGASLTPGPVLVEHRARETELQRLDEILTAACALEPPVVVIGGTWATKLRFLLGGEQEGGVAFRFVLRAEQAERLRREGQPFYYVDEIADWHARTVGVSLPEVGGRPLFGG